MGLNKTAYVLLSFRLHVIFIYFIAYLFRIMYHALF